MKTKGGKDLTLMLSKDGYQRKSHSTYTTGCWRNWNVYGKTPEKIKSTAKWKMKKKWGQTNTGRKRSHLGAWKSIPLPLPVAAETEM